MLDRSRHKSKPPTRSPPSPIENFQSIFYHSKSFYWIVCLHLHAPPQVCSAHLIQKYSHKWRCGFHAFSDWGFRVIWFCACVDNNFCERLCVVNAFEISRCFWFFWSMALMQNYYCTVIVKKILACSFGMITYIWHIKVWFITSIEWVWLSNSATVSKAWRARFRSRPSSSWKGSPSDFDSTCLMTCPSSRAASAFRANRPSFLGVCAGSMLKHLGGITWYINFWRWIQGFRSELTPSSQAPSSVGIIVSGVGSLVKNGRGWQPMHDTLDFC